MLGQLDVEFSAVAQMRDMNQRFSLVLKIAIFTWLAVEGRTLTFEEMYYIALVWVFADIVGTAIQIYQAGKK